MKCLRPKSVGGIDHQMKLRILSGGLIIAAFASAVLADDVPKPRLRAAPVKPQIQQAPDFPAVDQASGWPAAEVAQAQEHCASVLKGLDIAFAPLQPLGQPGGCGTAAPIRISAVAGIAITPAAEANCDFAEALHGWISSSLVPAARQHLKKKLVLINNASAYVCRRRNGLATGKLSEHGKANALDIATLGFDDGAKISIKGDWSGLKQLLGISAQAAFLGQIRRDACIRFTTVLGPGSDAYHGDHFHVDLAKRNSGYRICK